MATQLYESFASLHEAIENEDYSEALNVSNKILSLQPEDTEAFKCKLISLIHLKRFTDVIQVLSKGNGEDKHEPSTEYAYELAYALYREKRLEEALTRLKGGDHSNWLELKAQVSDKLIHETTQFPHHTALYLQYHSTHHTLDALIHTLH